MASFEQLDVKGLCTLGTVVVDYQGVRVVCQTIIPGEGRSRSQSPFHNFSVTYLLYLSPPQLIKLYMSCDAHAVIM